LKTKKNFLNRWLSASLQEMIECPYQPGNLRLLKKTCLVRLNTSFTRDSQNIFQNELFHYTVKQGLLICQGCPVKETLNTPGAMGSTPRLRFERA
jgi:hypothetical protein